MLTEDSLEKVSIEFLKQACLNAQGDVDKEMKISSVASYLSLESHFNEFPPEILANSIGSLRDRGFVEVVEDGFKIRVTWPGINHIIGMPGENPENYGAVAPIDMERICETIIDLIRESKERKNLPSVSVQELKRKITSFGSGPVNQALETLKLRELVKIFVKDSNLYVQLRS